jgi:hydroxymethylbilane synthase
VKIRIGTRGSDLALWQAHHVAALYRDIGIESELVVLVTRGDRIDDVPLTGVEGKAFFTGEIEQALLAREIDVAVHSHKDLPTESVPGLMIAAVPARGPCAERLLCSRAAHAPDEPFLPVRRGARVGTSSPRRRAQLATLRPDLELLELRGNVPTRVRKLREGRYDAIVLAAAGLERLALATDDLSIRDLPVELFVPAPAQGALAVQVREDDHELARLTRAHLHHEIDAQAVAAERALLAAAGGGCNLPLAAALERDGAAGWVAHGFLGAGHPAGARHGRWACARGRDPLAAAEELRRLLVAGTPTRTGPLAWLRIALTGSAGDDSTLAERLDALGAEVVRERVLEFEPIPADVAGALLSLRAGDLLVITSRQTVRHLDGLRPNPGVRVVAVGPSSARALGEAGWTVDVVGEGGGRELARALEVAPGARALWPCAEDALTELADELVRRGVEVRCLPLYRTRGLPDVALDPRVDVRVYLSPSAVAAALSWESTAHPHALRFALGPSTATALARAGLPARAPREGARSLTDELVRAFAQLEPSPEKTR